MSPNQTPKTRKGKGKGKGNGTRPQTLPVAVISSSRSKNPQTTSYSKGRSFRVADSELICLVPGVVATSLSAGLSAYLLNPGLTNVFPWLAPIAGNFASYRFHKLIFKYEPACASTRSGLLAFAFDPDPSNPLPSTLSALYAFRHRTSGSVFATHALDIGRRVSAGPVKKLVRTTATPVTNSVLSLYDLGTLYVYCGNADSTATLGTLTVSYDIEFFDPQAVESPSTIDRFVGNNGINNQFPLGLTPSVFGNSPVTYNPVSSASTFYFNATGNFLFVFQWIGTGGLTTNFVFTASTSVVLISQQASAFSTTYITVVMTCTSTQNTGFVTLTTAVQPTSTTSGTIYIVGSNAANVIL